MEDCEIWLRWERAFKEGNPINTFKNLAITSTFSVAPKRSNQKPFLLD
jgi:hypothetical protein